MKWLLPFFMVAHLWAGPLVTGTSYNGLVINVTALNTSPPVVSKPAVTKPDVTKTTVTEPAVTTTATTDPNATYTEVSAVWTVPLGVLVDIAAVDAQIPYKLGHAGQELKQIQTAAKKNMYDPTLAPELSSLESKLH